MRYSGVYIVCCQIAAKYATSNDEQPKGFKYHPGLRDHPHRVWLEQNHVCCQKYRKNLLTFSDLDVLPDSDPYYKQNFQLGRMVDILVCEKGDDLLVRSERNVIMNNRGIPRDVYYADSRKNPEFMDIIMLQNVIEYRRYRSKKSQENLQEDAPPFEWTSIDDDHPDDTTKECDPSSPPFVNLSNNNKQFIFNVPNGVEKIAVLVFATFQQTFYDSICLTLEGQPQTASYRANHSNNFLHINTVLEVAQGNEIGFRGVTIPHEGPWVEQIDYNDFCEDTYLRDNVQSVAIIKLASHL